ncbi:hypothetical protein WJX72_011078 [[Myrmecia] bisecta]|uniref:Uncharacterized protein n=1 Tax=[Myrmecia] bisecta TaxID=41462 RepID=A0AAW1PAR5_9CHLO
MTPCSSTCLQSSLQSSLQLDQTKGSLGDQLEQDAAAATNKLKPAHKYVPWVVVNGIPLGGAMEALPIIVCAAYTGERPEQCYADPPGNGALKRAGQEARVSWNGPAPLHSSPQSFSVS